MKRNRIFASIPAAFLLAAILAGPALAQTASIAQWQPPPVAAAASPLEALLAPLVPFAAAVIAAVLGVVARAVVRHLGLQANAVLAGLVDTAVKRAAGLAYSFMLAEASHIGDQSTHNIAIAKAVGYVTAALPDTLAKLGLTPDSVAAMVSAELGRLLAVDPTVGIPAAPAAAPALAPAAA